MKKDRILTSSFRKIASTYKRFISLLCMALLGVGFFTGIQATSPDMLKTLDAYYDNNNVYDIEVISTLGLTDQDIDKIKEIENIKTVEGVQSKDILMDTEEEEYVVKMIELNDNINKVTISNGETPTKSDEIAVEKNFITEKGYNIGDKITLGEEEKEYTIVGEVESPLYFGISRGTTTLGKGQIDYYIYAPKEAINQEYYSSIYVTIDGAKELTTNEHKYNDLIEETTSKIEEIQEEREKARFDELFGEQIKYLELQNISIEEADFPQSNWYIFDRTNNQAYSDFIDATNGIEKIGAVFPIIFYIVAVLISLVSMTRMVEEDRQELGTLKALGFSNRKIISKYVIYSFLATTLGGIIGMAIGFNLLPNIVWEIYKMLFTIPNFITEFNLKFGTIGLAICFICICGSAIMVAYKELNKMPSVLMRPKSPKMGKKILAEKITFIWNKLNFSNKIATRNLFRYKARGLVTIIGIAGCTALILSGFGLRDSISSIVEYQFTNVSKYDKMISLKSDTETESLHQELQENSDITNYVDVRMETTNIYNGEKDYEVNMVIPEEQNKLKEVISLNDVNNKKQQVELQDNEVILGEKIAKLLEVEKGGNITLKNDKDEEFNLKVTAIAENYIENYAYLNKATYEEIFGEYQTNVILVKTADLTEEKQDELDKNILNNEAVSSIISSEDTIDTVNDMMGSLDSVVVILVDAPAILAFVVMYNLSNINISERQREIATLKVLGFYDKEVDNYITKENIVLTIIGIILGLIIGVYLSHFIITTCETETLMFVRHVNILSYVYSIAITAVFMVIVNITTHFTLKKINMIDSLKSVE